MKVMADTNVFISALLFPESVPAKVLLHMATHHHLVLCDYIVAEIREVVSRKRPDLLGDILERPKTMSPAHFWPWEQK